MSWDHLYLVDSVLTDLRIRILLQLQQLDNFLHILCLVLIADLRWLTELGAEHERLANRALGLVDIRLLAESDQALECRRKWLAVYVKFASSGGETLRQCAKQGRFA